MCRYVIPDSELATRTLNVAVWHDKVGVNVFLGEVNITLDLFDSSAPNKMEEYQLLPRVKLILSSCLQVQEVGIFID